MARTRSPFQAKFIFCYTILLLIVLYQNADLFGSSYHHHNSSLTLEDSLTLVKNSLKSYLPSKETEDTRSHSSSPERKPSLENDLDDNSQIEGTTINPNIGPSRGINDDPLPLNSFVNSIFPIDALITYNYTKPIHKNITSHQFRGRYGAFSKILMGQLYGNITVLEDDGCSKVSEDYFFGNDHESKFAGRILVVLRGNCSFYSKSLHLSKLKPKAIIIADDEPDGGLITMYSKNLDDLVLSMAAIFITNNDYLDLKTRFIDKQATGQELTISIDTFSTSGLVNMFLSIMLSPPCFLLLIYSSIRIYQYYQVKMSKADKSLVKKLPIYIYYKKYLIPKNNFKKYLSLIQNFEPIESNSISSNDSNASATNKHYLPMPKNLDIIKPPLYYRTSKCSICLEKFENLSSEVIKLNCKHIFHENCLSNWLINFKKTCPLCKSTIDSRRTLSFITDEESIIGSTLDGDNENADSMNISSSSTVPNHHIHPPSLSSSMANTININSMERPSHPAERVPLLPPSSSNSVYFDTYGSIPPSRQTEIYLSPSNSILTDRVRGVTIDERLEEELSEHGEGHDEEHHDARLGSVSSDLDDYHSLIDN